MSVVACTSSSSMQGQARASARALQQPTVAAARSLSLTKAPAASSSARVVGLGRARPLAPCRPARQQQAAVCSLTSHPGEEQSSSGLGPSDLLSSFTVPSTGMAKNLGSSGGSATLQRSKLSNKQAMQQTGPKLDDGMGGGGLGKGIFNGGGGDGDGGDDDDYFNEFGDGDGEGGDDGFFRKVFKELYDSKAITAVLQEWYKTMADMPLILRQAAQMGLFSSAALVRFLSMDVRPNVTRFVTRSLPPAVSREVVGRLMADPAFMQKLVLEQMITVSSSLVYEAKVRGDRFWNELDLVAANVATLSAANAALVYLVAPTRAAPTPARFAWQNMLGQLPNNVFQADTPLRSFSTSSRAAAMLVKSAELCGVGMLAGAAQSSLAQAAVALQRRSDPGFQPSMPIPSVQQSALGFAAAQGIFANLRYQMVAGIDRYLFDHANYLWSYLAASGAFRAVSTALGDQTRRYLQGLPNGDAVVRARAARAAAYRQWAAQHAAASRRTGGVVVRGAEAPAAPAAPAAGGSSSGSRTGKKRRSKKASGGFEMGVGPAPAPVAA